MTAEQMNEISKIYKRLRQEFLDFYKKFKTVPPYTIEVFREIHVKYTIVLLFEVSGDFLLRSSGSVEYLLSKENILNYIYGILPDDAWTYGVEDIEEYLYRNGFGM